MMRIPTLLDGTPIDEQQFRTWIKALRSGEYSQGKKLLQGSEGYCCLGVACKVLIEFPRLRDDGTLAGASPKQQDGSPRWLKGINDDVNNRGLTNINGDPNTLMYLNDVEEWSFNQIADLLEEHYLGPQKVSLLTRFLRWVGIK